MSFEIAEVPPAASAHSAPGTRWEELERVTRSDTFVKSPRLASLLLHICERSWNRRLDELSEQQIGIYFFHRPPGFNAGEDAIVRGTARHLRKRLELYYDTEGRTSTLRISVPKGGYVARIDAYEPPAKDPPAKQSPALEVVPPQNPEPPTPIRRASTRVWSAAALLVLILIAALYALFRHYRAAHSQQNDGPVLLWKTLFQPNRRTVIVPGDPALNLYTAYKHRPVPMIEYTEQSYQHDSDIAAISPEGPGQLSKMNTTTMADLKLISELVRIPYREGLDMPDSNIEVRYARDLSQADLHGANLVLLGASTFNPWVMAFDDHLDFQLERGFDHYTFRVRNRAPRPGEDAIVTKDDAQALTIVSLTDSPSGNERVLIIEGSTMGSVYAGLHFLMTQRLWSPVIAAASADGSLHNFEVLLKCDFVKDEVNNTRVVTWHVH